MVTTTRADWGLLSPLAHKIAMDKDLKLRIVVSGTHLNKKFGKTYLEIKQEKLPIHKKIPILKYGDSQLDIAKTMARTLTKFSQYFLATQPDLIIILGDRYEAMCVSLAASNLNIPIAHLCGGESTQGANDEYMRHCITKMSYLHFPTTQTYLNRIVQLGENPKRVFNVGSLAVENIYNTPLMNQSELASFLDISTNFLQNFCLLTYHPATLEIHQQHNNTTTQQQIQLIIDTLLTHPFNIIATKANADCQGEIINQTLTQYARKFPKKIILKPSLGKLGYLSALQYAKFMIGNSSSGLSEAPILKIPTINIGDRQKGRLNIASVINTPLLQKNITQAIHQAMDTDFLQSINNLSHPFGNGNTSSQIVKIIKDFLYNQTIDIKKSFYDLYNDDSTLKNTKGLN